MIRFNHEYHVVELTQQLPNEIREWCLDKFGPPNGTRWWLKGTSLYFDTGADHMMFVLRWGDYAATPRFL